MAASVISPPSQIPELETVESVSPILQRLLECPRDSLPTLSAQVLASLHELPSEDKPTSYEGLLDVARFCVEEEPGWPESERAKLIGGHPRIGRQKGAISATSAEEQGATKTDEDTYKRLDRLNFLYERRYPSLRYVTYVAGRSRSAVADELDQALGPNIVGLPPAGAKLDPDDLAASWSGFPTTEILEEGSQQWKKELERGENALWEIAGDRAAKLNKEVELGGVTVEISEPSSRLVNENQGGESSKGSTAAPHQPSFTVTPDATSDPTGSTSSFDVPFLSQATFRALILASPILHTFFEQDLPASFLLQPVERQTSTKEAFLSALNDATGQGAGKAVTRERVKGLLGGLLGDVADVVGNRLQQQTIIGPKPSFDRAGKRGDGMSLEEAAKAQDSKLAPVSPAALSHKSSTAAMRLQEDSKERDTAEAVRLAQEALLSQRDSTQQFVIDAPGDETADTGEEHEEEVDDLVMDEGLTESVGEEGKLTGKEAELAKHLRSAEAQ